MPKPREPRPKEPLLLWWMPVVALLAPAVFAAWTLASTEEDAFSEALLALAWPGAALYLVMLAILWAGWKIELE